MIRGELYAASRTPARFEKAKASNPLAALGLRYEKKVQKSLALRRGLTVETNPWFSFVDANGAGLCSPDAIVFDNENALTMIVEVKLRYTPAAIAKLRTLYIPVVRKALALQVDPLPLVVCKHMIPDGPRAGFDVREALSLRPPVLQWLGEIAIRWGH